ncbi:MAG: hypothetical protein Q9226_007928 [Calogaya cf. arnoldii]
MNANSCKNPHKLASDLHPSIKAQVRYTVESIYGVHDFFNTYYTSLQDGWTQASSTIASMVDYLDPKQESQTTLFAVLGALSIGLAFLTAPTVAAGLLTAEVSKTFTHVAQSFAISVSQAPGVGRSLWPTGTDGSKIYQIGKLQEAASDVAETLSNRLDTALGLLMTDPVTFAAFADNGRYTTGGPPLDPNEVKNSLALSLQTYLLSVAMKKNGWYAIPMEITTQEAYEQRHNTITTCPHPRGICPGSHNNLHIYWSPASGRMYRLGQDDRTHNPAEVLEKIKNWGNIPLLFDGSYKCTKIGQRDNPELVHINYDGTLNTDCISLLPIVRLCRNPCPEYEADGSCLFPLKDDCSYQGGPLIRGGTADEQRRQRIGLMTNDNRPQSEKDADYGL